MVATKDRTTPEGERLCLSVEGRWIYLKTIKYNQETIRKIRTLPGRN